MKYIKMLGLAAVAAMALMAFLGASSASATVLCSVEATANCPSPYGKGTVIDASLESTATLETSGGTVIDTCTEGTVKGKISNPGSDTETVSGSIEELTWGSLANPCSKTTDTIAKGELEIHWISGTDNGTLTGKNSKVTINSIFGTCTYGTSAAGTHIGTLTATPGGNKMATLHIEALLPLTEGGGLCPAEGRWTGSYTVTTPEPLHVSTN